MTGARVAALHTYPVKGCRRLDHADARVEPWGLAGDRRWMIIDPEGVGLTQRTTPRLVTIHPRTAPGRLVLRAVGRPALDVPEPVDGRPVPVRVFRNMDPVPARLAGDAATDWLGDLLGRPARLVWLADPTARAVDPIHGHPGDVVSFADGYPLLLTNTASLDMLNGWLAETGDPAVPLPMDRLRPNIVVAGVEPWAEDTWLGTRLRIGAVTFRVAKSCARCVVTTTDQDTGERGEQPLRILARHRRVAGKVLFGVNIIPETGGPIATGDPVHPESPLGLT
ncbi:MOSC domain-containing protein [Solwaraspora sp. WMMB335]|uniref:MOSC domain-containing protein n=1 Tax=Solwaraspora sp. WMMB335 TaxID=3404118 RepID=UPI003B93F5CE